MESPSLCSVCVGEDIVRWQHQYMFLLSCFRWEDCKGSPEECMMGQCMKFQLRQNMQLLHLQQNPPLRKTSLRQSEIFTSLISVYQVKLYHRLWISEKPWVIILIIKHLVIFPIHIQITIHGCMLEQTSFGVVWDNYSSQRLNADMRKLQYTEVSSTKWYAVALSSSHNCSERAFAVLSSESQ